MNWFLENTEILKTCFYLSILFLAFPYSQETKVWERGKNQKLSTSWFLIKLLNFIKNSKKNRRTANLRAKFVQPLTLCQFLQPFTSSICANFLAPKNYKPKQKSCSKHFRTKKLLVKCWWNWPKVEVSVATPTKWKLLSSLPSFFSL